MQRGQERVSRCLEEVNFTSSESGFEKNVLFCCTLILVFLKGEGTDILYLQTAAEEKIGIIPLLKGVLSQFVPNRVKAIIKAIDGTSDEMELDATETVVRSISFF